jgi:hypothetical protein
MGIYGACAPARCAKAGTGTGGKLIQSVSTYGVSKFLFTFNTDPALRERFKADPDAVLASYPLNDGERAAVRTYDFKALYDMGIHPLLLSALANGSGIPIPKYLETIR